MAKIREKGRRFLALFLLAGLGTLVVLGLININRALITTAEARVAQRSVYQINEAFGEVMRQELAYSDFITVSYDENGEISMLSANATLMNRLASQASTLAQENISKMSAQGVTVPLGTAIGIPMFSGIGPRVRFEITPVGSVVTQFETEFEGAGINQTRHRISLVATASVRIVVPMGVKLVTVSSSVLMAESILVGDVPDSYIQVQDCGDALNFVA